MNDFTLFLNREDGTMHCGHCREFEEHLVDVEVGETAEFSGSGEEWHGDCLTQANTEQDLQASFHE